MTVQLPLMPFASLFAVNPKVTSSLICPPPVAWPGEVSGSVGGGLNREYGVERQQRPDGLPAAWRERLRSDGG
jgi:hypothetical protein